MPNEFVLPAFKGYLKKQKTKNKTKKQLMAGIDYKPPWIADNSWRKSIPICEQNAEWFATFD